MVLPLQKTLKTMQIDHEIMTYLEKELSELVLKDRRVFWLLSFCFPPPKILALSLGGLPNLAFFATGPFATSTPLISKIKGYLRGLPLGRLTRGTSDLTGSSTAVPTKPDLVTRVTGNGPISPLKEDGTAQLLENCKNHKTSFWTISTLTDPAICLNLALGGQKCCYAACIWKVATIIGRECVSCYVEVFFKGGNVFIMWVYLWFSAAFFNEQFAPS